MWADKTVIIASSFLKDFFRYVTTPWWMALEKKKMKGYDSVEEKVAVTWKHTSWKLGPMSFSALEV